MNNIFQPSASSVRYVHMLARIGAIVGAFFVSLEWQSVVIAIIGYYIFLNVGLSIMMHRYYSHRSFEFANKFVRYVFVLISLLALRGSPMAWAYLHRSHHEHVDTEGDPHTPVGYKFKFFGLVDRHNRSDDIKIFRIRGIMNRENILINQYYWLILLVVLLPLAVIDFHIFYYVWLIPVVGVQFSINLQNYLGHMPFYGSYRTYNNATSGNSQNSILLWPLYWGEAWHNNHHSHAKHFHYGKEISGKWWEFDPAATLIKLVKK